MLLSESSRPRLSLSHHFSTFLSAPVPPLLLIPIHLRQLFNQNIIRIEQLAGHPQNRHARWRLSPLSGLHRSAATLLCASLLCCLGGFVLASACSSHPAVLARPDPRQYVLKHLPNRTWWTRWACSPCCAGCSSLIWCARARFRGWWGGAVVCQQRYSRFPSSLAHTGAASGHGREG